jgi:hypothetical protein
VPEFVGAIAGLESESAFNPSIVEVIEQVETPEPFVAEHEFTVFPVPLADKVGVGPEITLLNASLSVTVTVEVATPSARTGLVDVMMEVAALAAAGDTVNAGVDTADVRPEDAAVSV